MDIDADRSYRDDVLRLSGTGRDDSRTADTIIRETCEIYGLTQDELMEHNKSAHRVEARRIAIYLIRRNTRLSLPAIGTLFGRDHTTILAAIRIMEARERSA